MEKAYLFEGEEVLMTSGDATVTLTNYRVQKNVPGFWKSYFISIALQNISTIELRSKNEPVLAVLGIGFLIAAMLAVKDRNLDFGFLLLIVGFVFVLIYLLIRKKSIIIASDAGTKLYIDVQGMSKADALKFINRVEHAKYAIK